jgi:hypothetical protein
LAAQKAVRHGQRPSVSDLAHVFLLAEECLLLAVLKARDAALRPPGPRTED